MFDRMGNCLMRIPKWQSLLNQVIGQIRSSCKALFCCLFHGSLLNLDVRHHICKNLDGLANRIDGIEEWLFIFLIVLVIGKGLPFHECQKSNQITIHSPGLAAS